MEGYLNKKPIIKKITFTQPGKFDLHLKDGRIVTVPVSIFPDIKKLTPAQRK